MINVALGSDVCREFICFHVHETQKWGKAHVKVLKQVPIQAQHHKEQRSGGFPTLYATFPLREVLLMCY